MAKILSCRHTKNSFLASGNNQAGSLFITVLSVTISVPFLPLPCLMDIIHLRLFLSFCVCEASLPCSKSAVFMQLPHPGTLFFHRICTKCLSCLRARLWHEQQFLTREWLQQVLSWCIFLGVPIIPGGRADKITHGLENKCGNRQVDASCGNHCAARVKLK